VEHLQKIILECDMEANQHEGDITSFDQQSQLRGDWIDGRIELLDMVPEPMQFNCDT
jgi:hypothetical protein